MSTLVKQKRSFKLLNNSILVELYKTPITHGSLLLPVQKITQQAKVVNVSDDLSQEFSSGDNLLIDPLRGIPIDGYFLFRKEEVLAKIEC